MMNTPTKQTTVPKNIRSGEIGQGTKQQHVVKRIMPPYSEGAGRG